MQHGCGMLGATLMFSRPDVGRQDRARHGLLHHNLGLHTTFPTDWPYVGMHGVSRCPSTPHWWPCMFVTVPAIICDTHPAASEGGPPLNSRPQNVSPWSRHPSGRWSVCDCTRLARTHTACFTPSVASCPLCTQIWALLNTPTPPSAACTHTHGVLRPACCELSLAHTQRIWALSDSRCMRTHRVLHPLCSQLPLVHTPCGP